MDYKPINKIIIIEVTDDNLASAVVSLAGSIWIEHYTPIIGKAQVLYMLDRFQSLEAISKQIKLDNYKYYLIKKGNDGFIGYLSLIPKPEQKELFLSKFYVISKERSKGYGKTAMQFIEDFAKKNNLNKITLTVNKNNMDSIRAYEKMGFRNIGALFTDIGDGFFLDDYKMEKILQNIGEAI